MNEEFRKRLESTFHEEASEHLHRLGSGLIAWERSGEGASEGLAESLYRAAHSLKGAARAVHYSEMESLCQAVEGSLHSLKSGQTVLTSELFDILNAARALLEDMLAARRRDLEPVGQNPALIQSLRDIEQNKPGGDSSKERMASMTATPRLILPPREIQAAFLRTGPENMVRLPMKKLEALHEHVDQLTMAKILSNRLLLHLEDMQRTAAELSAKLEKEFRSRASRARAGGQELLKLAGSLEVMSGLARKLGLGHRDDLAQVTALLLTGLRDVFMIPAGDLLEDFPKLARDLAVQTGKRVRVTISGADREMEKPVAEELREILLHLVRNAIDHGIEGPEARVALGKPAEGILQLSVSTAPEGKVRIEVKDDGRGFDPVQLKESAVRNGVLSAEEANGLDDSQVLQLAFRSGLTTRGEVTALSGRGLGLAIVRERTEKRGGSVTVESVPGRGTCFILILPSQLSTSRGLVVGIGDRKYVVPTSQVRHVRRYYPNAGKTTKWPAVQLDGEWLEVAPLAQILDMPASGKSGKAWKKAGVVLILGVEGSARAVFVESIHGEQEIVVKPLGPPFGKLDKIVGAVTLITGETALVLNLGGFRAWTPGERATAVPEEESASGPRKVLVVEDSITSRTLIKSLLETAGYSVSIAVDGVAALAALDKETFDIIVSDVEMPRMGGFELLARIRADEKWCTLPVVLVTSLDSEGERARGMAFGANAYMAKGEFDADRLLEFLGASL